MKKLKLIRAMYPCAILSILLIITVQVNGQSKNDLKLIEACKVGNIKKVEKLISNGANVNFHSKHHDPSLIIAIDKKNDELSKLLLKKGANVNSYSDDHITPLMMAIEQNNIELAKLLLNKGADPTFKKDCYFVEFQSRRNDGKYEVRVGKKQDGQNAFIMSILYSNEDIFNLLIKQGIDVNFTFQPDIAVGNYEVSRLYSHANYFNPRDGSTQIFNGLKTTYSETDYKKPVCIVNSKPFEPMTYTPLKVAILANKKNYNVIEKLSEISSHELNNDLTKGLKNYDSRTIEILKKYKFID